jgi:hypothetical protein
MYKRSNGEVIEECVRPVAYQQHLDDGWVVDIKDLKEPKKVSKNDNKNRNSK